MSPRRGVACAVAAVAVLGLAGCSDGNTPVADAPRAGTATASDAGGVQQVRITTGNDLRFHPSTIVVHPGRVHIILANTAGVGSGPPHNLRVDGLPGAVGTTPAGQTNEWEFTAPAPGRYRFVCTFHVEQGQTGTLVVER